MTTYGVLKPYGTADAGTWSLIKQPKDGSTWEIVARGKQVELTELAKSLNDAGAATFPGIEPVPAGRQPQQADRDPITRDDVLAMTEADYCEARARLLVDYSNAWPTDPAGPPMTIYRDSASGATYAPDAAELMTGPRSGWIREVNERAVKNNSLPLLPPGDSFTRKLRDNPQA